MRIQNTLLAVALMCAAIGAQCELMAVVGDVGSHHARVLVDGPEGVEVTARLLDSPLREERITLRESPVAITLRNLQSGTAYRVHLCTGKSDTCDEVAFTTFKEGAGGFALAVLSCDGIKLKDPGKDLMWAKLNAHGAPDGTLHIGDQIYADDIPKKAAGKTFEQLLGEFRSMYRTNWKRPVMRESLRRGAHWMIPDDHDVTNNFSFERFAASNESLRLSYLAGRQAFYEFQYQLHSDIPYPFPREVGTTEDSAVARNEAFYFRRAGSIGLALLDLRFERSFAANASRSLITENQRSRLIATLDAWEVDTTIRSVVVATPFPLIMHTTLNAEIADWFENERYGAHEYFSNSTLDILDILHRHKKVKLIVSGDVHLTSEVTACYNGNKDDCLSEVITSGMQRSSTTAGGSFHVYVYHMIVTKLTMGWHGAWKFWFDNTYFGQNALWIHVSEGGELSWEQLTLPYTDWGDWLKQLSSNPTLLRAVSTCALIMIFMRCMKPKRRQTPRDSGTSS